MRNKFFIYPHWATNDDYKIENTGGHLRDCFPTAIKNVYSFYRIKCPLMYYDFLEIGYRPMRGPIVDVFPFLTTCGIFFEEKASKNEEECIENIKAIVLSKNPAFILNANHAYLIVDVFKRDELINKYLKEPPVNYTKDQTRKFLNEFLDVYDDDEFFQCWNYAPLGENSLKHYRRNPFCKTLITRRIIWENLNATIKHYYKTKLIKKYPILQINGIYPSFKTVKKPKYRFTGNLEYYLNKFYCEERDKKERTMQECFKIYQDCLDPSLPKYKFEEACFVSNELLKFLRTEIFSNTRYGKEAREKFLNFRKTLFQNK